MKIFVARPVRSPRSASPLESKIVEFLNSDKEFSDKFVAHIVGSRPAFEDAMTKLDDEQVEALNVLLHSTAIDVWYEFSKKIDWAHDAIQFMGRSIDWYMEQDFYGVGKGKFPVNGAVEQVNDASPLKTARMLVQNSIADQRRRTSDELPYFLYLIGTTTDSKMRRILSVIANHSIVNAADIVKGAVEDSDKEEENPVAKFPRWQRNLLSPGAFRCSCELCAVKFVRGAGDLVEFMEKTDDDDMHTMALHWTTRFVTNITLAENAALDGVDVRHRARIQSTMLANMGSPFFLTREDMRQIVADDTLWADFTMQNDDRHESIIRNNAFRDLGTSMLSARSEITGSVFNFVAVLGALKAEYEYHERHPEAPKDPDVLVKLKAKMTALFDENEEGLRAVNYPVDAFREILNKL